MGMKFVNMDDKREYTEYRKGKKHERFVRENRVAEKTEPEVEVPEEGVDPAKEIVTKTETLGKVVKIDMLRMRNYPEGDVIKLLPKGTEVNIISDHDDIWYKVMSYDGTIGYCMKEFLLTYVNDEVHGVNDPRRCKTCPTP